MEKARLDISTRGLWGQRVTQVEKGCKARGREKHEEYRDVMSMIRTKLLFALLRSVLVSVRGSRDKAHKILTLPISCVCLIW